jgi:flagellar motility protein MotE (MotC chaperone)
MKKLLRELRVLPVVMLAAGCLLLLKVTGIALDGGYILSDPDDDIRTGSITAAPNAVPSPVQTVEAAPSPPVAVPPKQSWAQEVFGFPDTTGSVPETKPVEKKEGPNAQAVNPPRPGPDGKIVPLDAPRQPSPGERAVLERLQDRRQELDARAREIDIRENLLKATEKRIEQRAQELKDTESRITVTTQKKEEVEVQRFKGLVTMYENMKAKDAAKVFDRLEMKVLIELATQINPRRMADIMAQMQPEAAERLTVEMATRAGAEKGAPGNGLPKIEGKPNGS